MNNELFSEELILPTSEWGAKHLTALNVIIDNVQLEEVLSEDEGFFVGAKTSSKLIANFVKISRDLLRQPPSMIARVLKE
jgi:hypothetical protein